MNPDKQIIIDELKERVNSSPYVLVVDYAGMSVTQFSELRASLQEGGAECHVAKNTFMRRVLEEEGLPDISAKLVGQTAFITGQEDICAACKAVDTFSKKSGIGKMLAGILDGEALDDATLKALANIPSREALLSQLLSVINGPASAIARILQAKIDKDKEEGE